MPIITLSGGSLVPIWVYVVNVIQVIIVLWFAFVLLLGGWKLFRFLLKWKP